MNRNALIKRVKEQFNSRELATGKLLFPQQDELKQLVYADADECTVAEHLLSVENPVDYTGYYKSNNKTKSEKLDRLKGSVTVQNTAVEGVSFTGSNRKSEPERTIFRFFEKMHDKVYYKTLIQYVQAMLNVDKLVLKKNPEYPRIGKQYYMSFLVDPKAGVMKKLHGNAVIVIDGEKLNDRYAGEWEKVNDLLFAKENVIRDFTKYIKAIHLLSDVETAKPVAAMAIKKHIPVYIYNNRGYFVAMDTRKAITVKDIEDLQQTKQEVSTEQQKLAKFYLKMFNEYMLASDYYALSRGAQLYMEKARKLQVPHMAANIIKAVAIKLIDAAALEMQRRAVAIIKARGIELSQDSLEAILNKRLDTINNSKEQQT